MGLSALRDLGFGDGLARHLLNYDEASPLAFRCKPPLYWLDSPIRERSIVPLWECGTVLSYYHRDEVTFQKCSLEDINNVWVKYKSCQALLADLFLDLYEDEHTEEELNQIADELGFRHVQRLLFEAGKNNESNYDEWRELFPYSCEA
jgi:hypothetical protein